MHIRVLAVGDRQPDWVDEAFGVYTKRFPKDDEQVVWLDEVGRQFSSKTLARRLADWQADGRDLCFVIGGPDGVASSVRSRADFCWSLSQLTLPHGLARAVLAEQLYRAWSLQSGHPYHRD